MKFIERNALQMRNMFDAREWLTAVILGVSLLVTYQVWQTAEKTAERTIQTAFDFRVRESTDRIQARVMLYEQVLRATQGLFRASPKVEREDFHVFVNALDLAQNYPGIQGVGFSKLIQPSALAAHIAEVRNEGFPHYEVTPAGERPVYSSIVYLEPFDEKNLRAFGYDMFSEPVRRTAMEQARDTGKVAVSAKVTLVQEGSRNVQAGFLMYLPVYANEPSSSLPANIAQRRKNLVGWVYAPFRMNDFMLGLEGSRDSDLDIEIYDESMSDQSRMYDSVPSVSAGNFFRPLRSISQIIAANRTWAVATTALPAFRERMQSDRPLIILQAGFSISLMLALLTWLFLDDRAQALHAANQAMQLALYDTLTGLPNRKLLEERINQALTHARRHNSPVALLFIDLDKFKPVNDNYGHAYGDLLLKDVAARLHDCMRESDTAARLGGDEFVALLSEVDGKAGVTAVATKILNRLSKPYEISGHVFEISASIGAAFYPDDAADAKALMRAADMAMYQAKNSGRGTVSFANERVTDAA